MRAVAYLRVSTDEQAESGLSIESQRRKVEAQAIVSDFDLVEVIVDAGESARTMERPGAERLMQMVHDKKVDAVIITKLDRLTRNIKDLGAVIEVFDKKKVGLVSTDEALNTTTAAGRLVVNMLGAVAQWEREAIAERTRDALEAKRAIGKVTGAPRFGYSVDGDGNAIEDDREQEIILIVRELREMKVPWEKVANELTRRGYRNRKDNEFSTQGIYLVSKKLGIK